MPRVIAILIASLMDWLRSRLSLQLELLALRHQVAVYKQRVPRPKLQWYLLRDRDRIDGDHVQQRVKNMGIDEVKIAPRSPWHNPYCERVIGSMRRDMLDQVIVLNARHLTRLLTEYVSYYHRCRTHLSLDMDCPESRAVESPDAGVVLAVPALGGLHHQYARRAA